MNLTNAVVYDIETYPNAFTLRMEMLNGETAATWEISHFRDDRRDLITWFNHLRHTQTPMIGFNSINFDYPVIHFIFNNPNCTVQQIYDKAQSIILSLDRFGHLIWADNRFAPQIDLFKINHFDNKAKSTSLKALQINMRSENVIDTPVEFGTVLTKEQVDNDLIPYNISDVEKTKRFALYNMDAINFRISLIEQFGVDVLNWPDTKIGSRMMEDRLGKELCYETDPFTNKRKTRQTPRSRIALADIIFPYVQFENPEFQRILNYLRGQVLGTTDIQQFSDVPPMVKTKGVFTNLKATVGDIDFYFGTGGIHGSVSSQRIVATDGWLIRDIDVAALYPSIAIVNRLAPAHLGERFVQVYSELPLERKKWQKEKGKKSVEANTLKLASNGVYGNSNNPYSVFYDPQFTLTITINGQLMLCMLAERLLKVPTLKIIQINTDGITYFVHRDYEPYAAAWCREWEKLTALVLEDANYSRMWIRDVNNYIAESPDRSLKTKGAYWTPDPVDYQGSISNAQPPAWHKDLGNVVTVRAAVAAMVHGVDPSTFIRLTTNPYDFMCRIKVKRSDNLFWGQEQIQRNSRYYVSTDGRPMIKTAPAAGPNGAPKRANGVSQFEYDRVMKETGGQWDARVCTKNKSIYQNRSTAIQAGHIVTICNDVKDFNFANLNYDWYINEAKKLVIA
jgi:hypothetical protein